MTFDLKPSGEREIVIIRSFAAPATRVFAAWTTPALVRRWLLGPDGWTLPVCEIDLRVGGAIRYVWRHTDGREFGLSGAFREIEPPRRLVHTELFDADWTGGETIVTTEFKEADGTTRVRITVLYASRAARDGAARSGMETGVAASYDRLDGMLGDAPGPAQPRIVEHNAASAAVVRATIPFAEIPAVQRAARERLAPLASHPDAQPLGPRLTIFRPPRDGKMDYAPGVLLPRAVALPDGLQLAELPQGRAAHLRLVGSLTDLPGAWSRLFAACKAEGWTPAGLNWEIYTTEGADGDETDLYALLG